MIGIRPAEQYKAIPPISGILLVAIWPLGIMTLSIVFRISDASSTAVNLGLLTGLLLPIPALIWRSRRQDISWKSILEPLQSWQYVFLLLACSASAILGIAPKHSLLFIALTLIGFLIAAAYARMTYPVELHLGLAVFSTVGAAILLILLVLYPATVIRGVRFGDNFNVNAFGFFAMSCGSFAFCWDNKSVRYLTLATAVICILAVSSRASLLGLMVVVLAQVFIGLKREKLLSRLVILSIISGLVCLLWFEPLKRTFVDVFDVDDPYRGLGTALTGRLDRWETVFGLFKENPLFGVGFRCSEMVVGFPPDNGYLAYLSETGIIGSLTAFMLIGAALKKSIAHLSEPLNKILLSASCGYLAHSVFERFFFNVGNPGSILFILWAVYATSLRRRWNHVSPQDK